MEPARRRRRASREPLPRVVGAFKVACDIETPIEWLARRWRAQEIQSSPPRAGASKLKEVLAAEDVRHRGVLENRRYRVGHDRRDGEDLQILETALGAKRQGVGDDHTADRSVEQAVQIGRA